MESKFLFSFCPIRYAGFLVVPVFFMILLLPATARALTVSPVRTEISGDPGSTQSGSIKATNSENTSITYYTNVQTFEAADETGNPTFRVTKSDLATWINIDSSITLGPKETKDLPYTVSVPKDADPGGYFAVIFLSDSPPAKSQGGTVSLGSQIGSLVLFRVNGYIQQGADILEFDAKSHAHWYTSLPVSFYYRFQNSGQSWVRPLGDIIVQNFFRRTAAIFPANPNEGNVLPQSIRRFENSWVGKDGLVTPPSKFWPMVAFQWRNFAFGPYTVKLNLAYGSGSMQSATAATTVWIFPWQLSLVVLIAALIIFFLLRFGIRRYNRWVITSVQKGSRR